MFVNDFFSVYIATKLFIINYEFWTTKTLPHTLCNRLFSFIFGILHGVFHPLLCCTPNIYIYIYIIKPQKTKKKCKHLQFYTNQFSVHNGYINTSYYRSNVELNLNWNLCSDSNLFPYLQAPELGALQLQVTYYNLSYTADKEDSCYKVLPSCMTSFDLPVVAGVQYNITVSTLSNGRESQNNLHCNFGMFSALCILMDTSSKNVMFFHLYNKKYNKNHKWKCDKEFLVYVFVAMQLSPLQDIHHCMSIMNYVLITDHN